MWTQIIIQIAIAIVKECIEDRMSDAQIKSNLRKPLLFRVVFRRAAVKLYGRQWWRENGKRALEMATLLAGDADDDKLQEIINTARAR